MVTDVNNELSPETSIDCILGMQQLANSNKKESAN